MNRIIVRRDDGTEKDVTEAVQITYDCLRASLDWGSGMLDTHEVNQVILLAEAAGFADFEKAVSEVWEARHRDAVATIQREAWAIGKPLPTRGNLATEVDRAAMLHEIHRQEDR